MTAEIYSKIALEFGSSKKKAEEDISSAKEAESQVRIQMEALKMSLERAKKIVPKLKDQINSIIRDLDKMFKEEKPSGAVTQNNPPKVNEPVVKKTPEPERKENPAPVKTDAPKEVPEDVLLKILLGE